MANHLWNFLKNLITLVFFMVQIWTILKNDSVTNGTSISLNFHKKHPLTNNGQRVKLYLCRLAKSALSAFLSYFPVFQNEGVTDNIIYPQ